MSSFRQSKDRGEDAAARYHEFELGDPLPGRRPAESAATTERPSPWRIPPNGFHFEAVSEDTLDWIVPATSDKGCRYQGGDLGHRGACGRPAVASLRRGKAGWWNYCERHLYGRWIEDGQVMHWRMVPDAD